MNQPSPTNTERAIVVICDVLERPLSAVHYDSHFTEDLLCDDLQQAEIIRELERELGAKYPSTDCRLTTVRDAIEWARTLPPNSSTRTHRGTFS